MNIEKESQVKTSSSFMKTERELHQEFLKLGANRRKLTNELLAILPEIYERRIYKKYSATIIEYAGKFGGLSKGVVLKRLRLEKYLENKPKLREAIITEGVHKVALIATMATPETEEAWVDKLKNMSKNAIQELTKEVRNNTVQNKNSDIFSALKPLAKSISCSAISQKITIEFSDEMRTIFLKFKQKISKESAQILSNKEVMEEILKRLEEAENRSVETKISVRPCNETRKVILEDNFSGEKSEVEARKHICQHVKDKPLKISRYIPIAMKKSATVSTQGKCAYPNCSNPSEIFHHRERFSEMRKKFQINSHASIIPLCKIHHEFTHNGIIANESQNPVDWQFDFQRINLKSQDLLYRKIRQTSL